MSNWIEHDDTLYNLDKFTQIVRGDEDEILLTTLTHNMDWDDSENQICSLKFKDKDQREKIFEHMRLMILGAPRI